MSSVINNFQIFDYIITIIIILFIFISIWKGLIQSILGLLTWVGSIILTLNFYKSLSNYISHLLNKIDFFQNWDQMTQLIGIILSIPIIFLISLIILKKIRKIISADIDKATLGVILDKIFGAIYGCFFSYLIFSTLLYFSGSMNQNYLFIYDIYNFFIDKSLILNQIDEFNNTFIYSNLPFFDQDIEIIN